MPNQLLLLVCQSSKHLVCGMLIALPQMREPKLVHFLYYWILSLSKHMPVSLSYRLLPIKQQSFMCCMCSTL